MTLPGYLDSIAQVTRCAVRSTLPPAWAQMPALLEAYINLNRLSGTLPDAWGANGSFPSLVAVNLMQDLGFPGMLCLGVPQVKEMLHTQGRD